MTEEVPQKEEEFVTSEDVGKMPESITAASSQAQIPVAPAPELSFTDQLNAMIESKGTFFATYNRDIDKVVITHEKADAECLDTGITIDLLDNGNFVTRFEYDYRDPAQKKKNATVNKGSDEFVECDSDAIVGHVGRFLDKYLKFSEELSVAA